MRQAYDQLGPIDRFFGFITGVGYQYRTNEALNHQQQASDPNHPLRAGGATWNGETQFGNLGKVRTETIQVLQDAGTDFTVEVTTAGGGAIVGMIIGRVDDANDLRKAANLAKNSGNTASQGAQSFNSFKTLKRALGPAGDGRVYHHIVEQRKTNVARFGAQAIHNTANVVNVPREVNVRLNALYSSKRPDITGSTTLRVREWLNTKSYADHQAFGLRALENVQNGTWR